MSSSSGQNKDSRRNFAAAGRQRGFCPHFVPTRLFLRCSYCDIEAQFKFTVINAGTCGQGRRGGASRLLSVSPPCLGDRGGTVVPPTFLHAPPPLRLPLPVDENLRGAQLLQELLLDVLGFNPSLLLLPARQRARTVTVSSNEARGQNKQSDLAHGPLP